jgi:predicted transposase YbfD/YdcC
LRKALEDWLDTARMACGKTVGIDGKTIRGAGKGEDWENVHIVSAFINDNHLAFGEVRTEGHSNEITAIAKLLDLFDFMFSTVTIDAMGCQKKIVEKIIQKLANYVIALKENQRALYEDVKKYFALLRDDVKWAEAEPVSRYDSGLEKGHGRIERRIVTVSYDVDWLLRSDDWAGLKCVIEVESIREVKEGGKDGKWVKTVDYRYYISSLDAGAERLCEIIRGHWGIENRLHWILDFDFGEDKCHARKGHSAENLNVMRKLALALIFKADPDKRTSVKCKMIRAAVDESYLEQMLFG